MKENADKKRRIGMYGDTPRVKVGKYIICRQDPDGANESVWIEEEEETGGEFDDSLFEKCIEEFLNKNL